MKKTVFLILICLPLFAIGCKQKAQVTQPAAAVEVQAPDYQKIIEAKVFIKPGSEAAFIEAAKTIIESSNKEEGCLFYQLYQDPYVKTNFIFVEKYKNQASVDFHFGTTYFKEFGPKITDLTSKPSEIMVYDIAGEKKQ